jgi:1-acyl-sn-glycerol-3-phosphate acyltransferase
VIAARKSRMFNSLFEGHARARLVRTFDTVRVRGLEAACSHVSREPLLLVSNHTSWWDPLLSIVLCNHLLRADAFAMMDAKNLRALPFFGRVGAFGVDLADARDGARAIRYAASLLDRPRRVVWVFAQGRERPITERPLVFRAGSAEVSRVARARVLPVALRYEFGRTEKPTVLVSLGAPLDVDRDVVRGRAAQEAAVTYELDRIDASISAEDEDSFTTVLRGRTSPLADWAARALAWLAR